MKVKLEKPDRVYHLTLTENELDAAHQAIVAAENFCSTLWVWGGCKKQTLDSLQVSYARINEKIRAARKQCNHIWKMVGRGDLNMANTGEKSVIKECTRCGLKTEGGC